MCLTIPKKVVALKEDMVILEKLDGTKQEAKSIIPVSLGDFVLTQQNVIVEKLDDQGYQEVLSIIQTAEEKKER